MFHRPTRGHSPGPKLGPCLFVAAISVLWVLSAPVTAVRALAAGPKAGLSGAAAKPPPAANPYLGKGRNLYDDQKYKAALAMLRRAYNWPKATPKQQIEALKHIGFIHIILGKPARAEGAFTKLLKLNKDFDLPDWTSPKLLRTFRAVRQRFLLRTRVILKHPELPPAVAGKPIDLTLHIWDAGKQVGSIFVFYRSEGSSLFNRTVMKRAGLIPRLGARKDVARVPDLRGAKVKQAYYLEYYFVATYLRYPKRAIAALGGPTKPLRLKVEVPEPPKPKPKPQTLIGGPPFYKTWWFWTIVGGVAAGGGTAAYFLARPKAKPTTGGVVITLTQP